MLKASPSIAFNQAYSFETKEDSIHKFGELISKKYVLKGYTTIDLVAKKYCPANPKGSRHVMKIMKSDYKRAVA